MWASVGMGVLVAVLVVHVRTAVVAPGPVAVPDIPAYLGIAQWVGGDGLAPDGIPFQPGYGLLLAPLVAVAQVEQLATQGEVVHKLALIVNSLAATAAIALAARLALVVAARLGPDNLRRWRIAGAAALFAAVHPALSSASRIAWPETLLSLAVLVVALAVASATKVAGTAASLRAWACAGLIATLAVALHARMVVLAVAVVLTALLCRIGRRAWASLGGGLLIGSAATALALSLTGTWPTARLSEAAQLDRGAEPMLTVAGQLLALGGGTVGLGLIGLTAGLGAAARLTRKPPHRQADAQAVSRPAGPGPLTAALICLALGALSAVLLGGWTLTGSARADALLYGRYVDPWAVPLAVTALAWLTTRPATPRSTSATSDVGAAPSSVAAAEPAVTPGGAFPPSGAAVLGATATAALLACALVVSAADGYDAAPRRIMTQSFSPAWTWLDDRLSAVAVAALAVTLLGTLLVAAARRSQAATGALVAAVLALGAVATVSNHRHLADVGTVARDQVVSAGTVSDAVESDGLTCLAHDSASVPDYALWLYRLELPEIAHERVRLNNGDRPCSELVIADDNLAQRCTNARHLIDEPAASWSLWQLPNRTCTTALNNRAQTAGVASHDGTYEGGICTAAGRPWRAGAAGSSAHAHRCGMC